MDMTYLACGLLMHNSKLLMTNDEGRKQHDLEPSAQTESSMQQSGSFMHKLCVYYVYNQQITGFFFGKRRG
jgi:hypothetical protein